MKSKRKEDDLLPKNNKKLRYGCNFCSKEFASSDGVSKHCRKNHQQNDNYKNCYQKGKINTYCHPISKLCNLSHVPSLYCGEQIPSDNNKDKIDVEKIMNEEYNKLILSDKSLSNVINLADLGQIPLDYLIQKKEKLPITNYDDQKQKFTRSMDSLGTISIPNSRHLVLEKNFVQLHDMFNQQIINLFYQNYLDMFKYNPIFLQNYYQLKNNFGLIIPYEVTGKDGLEIIKEFCQIV